MPCMGEIQATARRAGQALWSRVWFNSLSCQTAAVTAVKVSMVHCLSMPSGDGGDGVGGLPAATADPPEQYILEAQPFSGIDNIVTAVTSLPEGTAIPLTPSSSSSSANMPTASATRVCDPFQAFDLPFAATNISDSLTHLNRRSNTVYPIETTSATDVGGLFRAIIGATDRIMPHATHVESDFINSMVSELSERYLWLIGNYKLSKLVRILVLCHLAFLLLFILFSPIYVLFTPFLLIGYIGARTFNFRLLTIYSTYIILDIIVGFVLIFLIDILLYLAKLTITVYRFSIEDLDFVRSSPIIYNLERTSGCV